ncbi:5-methylcytosine restriction system specificity protein McrC [Tenacibaculum halocynthiae]|uniref:5-methylcytosine restriction system specificity protein McrC n=1 Tax=Tenacibaculum halocynthiae TaxID=1254437 RepID=UPI0038930AA7
MNNTTKIIRLGEHKNKRDIEGSISLEVYYFKNKKIGKYGSKNKPCFTIQNNVIKSHYYIGVDWVCKTSNRAVYISPKLNEDGFETDYLKMLLICLNDTEASKHINSIYDIKNEASLIEIDQQLDLLSPLLIIQFLNLVKQLIKKGLKKSYYREEKHLNARVKGKLLVSQTIKHHTFRSEPLKTICAFDTFGLDHPENQILKTALLFIQTYLSKFPEYTGLTCNLLQYCLPAFEEVSIPTNISSLKHFKSSPFFNSYKETVNIAKLILKRFGHNVRNVEATKIKTQPFWINMPLLFELYAFTFLRKTYGNNIHYQYKSNYQELDFLLNTKYKQLIIDTKYKTVYCKGKSKKEDIRQLAGYARMNKVYKELEKATNETIDCLIIYPIRDKDNQNNKLFDINHMQPIDKYVGFHRLGLSIPYIKNKIGVN